jgi:hypothetical protein
MPNITLTDESFDHLLESLEKETDRGSAIVLHTYIESQIKTLLSKRLLPCFNIPGSFCNKVRLAFSVGLLTDKEKEMLKYINDIRNDFAHSISVKTFDLPEISNKCRSLQPLEYFTLTLGAWESKTPRRLYECIAMNLIFILHFRTVEPIPELKLTRNEFDLIS